jgi:predicted MFS family arabinose efflux permease
MISHTDAEMAASLAPNVRAAARATRSYFILNGIGAACWAPMVPFAKARLELDEARLGVVLLCMGIGAVIAMPIAGFMLHRHGNRIVLAIGSVVICAALPLLAMAPSVVALGASLMVFGASLGTVDVAMNAHAVEVERLDGRPLMSGFHALYSIGGLVGSAGMTALLGTGAPLVGCAVAVAIALVVLVATQWNHVLPVAADPAARRAGFQMPSPTALLIGGMCLVMFLAEGAMLDWTAVFLRAERGVALTNAGVGYAAFSIAMAIGRLLGDRATAAVGPPRIVRYGSVIAAAGFLLASLLPWAATSIAGFILVGIGASNIVPVLFSAAGRLPGAAPGVSIATVTALGYAGMLAGPGVIGLVARVTSLPVALTGVGALVALVTAGAAIVARTRVAPAGPR